MARKKRLVRKDYKEFEDFVTELKDTLPDIVPEKTMLEETFYVFAVFPVFRYSALPPQWFVERFAQRFGRQPEKAVLFDQGETLMLGLGSVEEPMEVV